MAPHRITALEDASFSIAMPATPSELEYRCHGKEKDRVARDSGLTLRVCRIPPAGDSTEDVSRRFVGDVPYGELL